MTELERARRILGPYADKIAVRAAGEEPDADGAYRALPVAEKGLTLLCPAGEPGADTLLRLAADLLRCGAAGPEPAETEEARWRRRLTGAWTRADEEAHPLPAGSRCVMALQPRAGDLPGGLGELVPVQRQDALIPLDRRTAALVKDIPRSEGPAELLDFAGALRETFLEETGRELLGGIGDAGAPPAEGLRQAQQALLLGLKYDGERGVWRWQRLVAERMLEDLPTEKAEEYAALIFNRRTARALDEELLNTAEVFLRSSLSLSDTARQLFIHRSTLIYRLDKLQKATGLDLRLLDDAMIFWLLLRLRRGRGDR